MKTFAGQQVEPLFQFSWLVVFLSLLFCGSVAIVLGFTVDPKLAMAVSLSLLALLYLFFGESLSSGPLVLCPPRRHSGWLGSILNEVAEKGVLR